MNSSAKSPIAVAIFSFNRPLYLKQVLDSIERNTNLDNLVFYFFQDGAVNKFSGRTAADQEDIDKCVQVWDASNLPNKHTIRHTTNLGIGICQFEAKEYLFKTLGYECCMFFEDDLVVNKYYLRTLKIMLDQFRFDDNVGAVMCYGNLRHKFTEEEKSAYLLTLHSGNDPLWGWATWSTKWDEIRPFFLNYFQYIRNIDYQTRPNKKILKFYKKEGFSINASSQDAAFYYAMNKSGLFSLNTRLRRGKYIGANGEHMRPEKYLELGYNEADILESDKESYIEKFEPYNLEKFLTRSNSIFRIKG